VQAVPLGIFTQNNLEPAEGMRINTSQGIAEIIQVGAEEVKLDFNHPLAGKTIYFEIKVEELKKAR
jgi:FKBP-type peptidyl-prolyl cis-trans isomerase 2